MILTCFLGHSGIAAANTLHSQYFVGVDHRERYYEFCEQLVRVKDDMIQPIADNVQQLLVKYIREDLGQQRAANWYEGHWTGPF